MNQKERMLAGLPYKAWMDGLSQERLENKKKIFAFNHLEPDKIEEKEKLLKEILGKTGKYVNIEAPFHCDYGYNIEVGKISLRITTSRCLTLGKSGSVQMPRLLPMFQFILPVIPSIPIPEIQAMNTASALLSEIMSGLAEMPVLCRE